MKQLWQWMIASSMMLVLAACGGGAEKIEVGATAPDFRLPDANGGEVALTDYSGQPVLLYFHMAVG